MHFQFQRTRPEIRPAQEPFYIPSLPPISRAAYRGNLKEVKRLLAIEENAHEMVLVKAKREKDMPLVRDLIHLRQKRGYVARWGEGGEFINEKNHLGRTALTWAAEQGYVKIVRVLLQAGENVCERDKLMRTVLMHACRGGCAQVVYVLLQAGAQVNEKDQDGCTALWYAILAPINNQYDIITLLIGHGAVLDGLEEQKEFSGELKSYCKRLRYAYLQNMYSFYCWQRMDGLPFLTSQISFVITISAITSLIVNYFVDSEGNEFKQALLSLEETCQAERKVAYDKTSTVISSVVSSHHISSSSGSSSSFSSSAEGEESAQKRRRVG